jgi:molybdenum cofactor biosynthesis enzyme MoaA
MMRFPPALVAALLKARIERFFRPRYHRRLLTFVDPADVLHSGSAHPVSHEKIRDVISSSARVIWIGGSEPMDHPGIAHLVRALAQSNHLIFLETNGVLLRRRIHEFQPLPQFFLVVRAVATNQPEFELALEGLHAARLSGFSTVLHSVVDECTDLDELDRLRNLLLQMDVDVWLVTAASASSSAAARVSEARNLIPSAAWRRFSAQVERELLIHLKSSESKTTLRAEDQTAGSAEEGIKVA